MPEQVPVQSTYDSVIEANAFFDSAVVLDKVRDNVMDELHSPNPVWTLYMVEEDPLKRASAIGADEYTEFFLSADQEAKLADRLALLEKLKLEDETYNKVIIASTGRTDEFAIGNVKIKSYLADQGKTTNLSLDIQVPQNADFYDHMFNSAKFLGIRRWDKVPMLLDMKIRGVNPYSGLPQSGPRKTFLVQIVTSGLRMDETGTHVEMEMRNLYDTVHGEVYDKFNEQLELQGDNPGLMLWNLMAKLKDRQNTDVRNGIKDISDEFKFEFYSGGDDAAIQKLITQPFTDNKFLNYDLSNMVGAGPDKLEWTKGTLSVTYNQGESVFNVIRNILLTSPYLIGKIEEITEHNELRERAIAKLGTGPLADKAARVLENEKLDIKEFFHMETHADIIDFDYRRNNYAVRVTYRIYIHRTPFGYAAPGDIARNHIEDKRKLVAINRDIGIYKKYDHLFTGKNQQVLGLDWNFDNLYFNQVAARNNEATHEASSKKDGIYYTNSRGEDIDPPRQLRSIVDPIGGGGRGDSAPDNPTNPNPVPVIRTGVDADRERAYSQDIPAGPQNFSVNPLAGTEGRRGRNYFAGDIERNTEPVVAVAPQTAGKNIADRRITAPLESGPKIPQTGITGPTDEGANLLKRYFNSAWAGKFAQKTSDMITVQMTVRGDPFYLPDVFDDHRVLATRDINPTRPLLVMIRADQPAEYNDHGFVEINKSNTLNAVYQVIAVNHSWNENSWTCELDMRMEQGTDVNRLLFLEPDEAETENFMQTPEALAARSLAAALEERANEDEEANEEDILPDNIIDVAQIIGVGLDRGEKLGSAVYLDLDMLDSEPANALTADPVPDIAGPLDAGQQAAINERRRRQFPSDLTSITLPLGEGGGLDQEKTFADRDTRRIRFEFDNGELTATRFLEPGTATPRPVAVDRERTRRIRLAPANLIGTDLYAGPNVRVHEEFAIRPDIGVSHRFLKAPLGWSGVVTVKGHTWVFESGHNGYPSDYRINQNAPDYENLIEGAIPRLDFFDN